MCSLYENQIMDEPPRSNPNNNFPEPTGEAQLSDGAVCLARSSSGWWVFHQPIRKKCAFFVKMGIMNLPQINQGVEHIKKSFKPPISSCFA